MNFVHPLFLAGTLAALIPLLIHLLTRDRVRKTAFSTLRFFAASSQKVLRRKKWQEMLLLAMRMLIFALVAIAFSRPFFGGKKDETAGLSAKRARVIVADVSASMSRGESAKKLKNECERALADLSEGSDAVGLVMMGEGGRGNVEVGRKFDAVRAAVQKIKPGQGTADIAAALETADEMLKNVRAAAKDIVLISDLQRSSWNRRANGAAELRKLSADVKLAVIAVTPGTEAGTHSNVVIVDHYCPESVVLDQTAQTISVKVANLSGKELSDVPVKLTIVGKNVADGGEQKANIKAGGTMLVRFSHVFDAVGDTPMVVRVGGGGGSDETRTPENTVYFNTRVMARIPVVILNGSPSANRAVDGASFLSLALSPKGSPPFEVKVIEASKADPADVKDASVVFLPDVDKLKPGMHLALADLLHRGGGVMFLPGENVSANVFNTQFGGSGTDAANDLAPCRLKTILQAPKDVGDGGVSLSKIDFGHAIFREFAQPHHGDFSGVRFFRWWDVRDYQGAVNGAEAERTRVLARFDDGRPALLERQISRGESLLFASSTDLRWTNFPEKAAVFQPFVHLAAKYLSIRTEPRTAYTVGDVLPIPAGCNLNAPDGTTHTHANTVAQSAGFYTLLDNTGKELFCYAVNVDPAEMDTATVTADEILSAMQQPRNEESGTASDQESAPEKDGSRTWWYITLAVAALFAMELFVANRTLRH